MDDDCPMEDSSASARERAQRLLNKNIELENGLRKAAKSKVPSDPNAWLQMRENYEDILLGDHDFSEKHEIEYALWQLHYRRIEEFRSHINAAATSSHGGKSVVRPERINKIRSVFKGFLSEATGFYHDLMLKIRSKYGLPLGYISENPGTQAILEKDIKKSADTKKGMLSCHRCLIYLGDLARYKVLYADGGDNAGRDYAAASSYYIQAASLWPSSGNPHHQLAILASYSGDEFMAIYRYFRSLAVESPFSTARDNLIIAFEKNRQSYFQLAGDTKTSRVKMTPVRVSGRGRGRGEAKLVAKDTNRAEANLSKEKVLSIQETYKAFCIRFVRLNGVLFTRTSLETFGDIFSSVICDLCGLLSSGMEEDLSFGSDAAENRLFFVRMISILIYSVHNANRESEGQSYAEILQRSVLLQNAFTAAFEIVGHILKRCVEFKDILSSYLSPAILVFIEWLACCPDVAAGPEVTDDKQATARSFFWTQFVNFFNELISSGYAFVDRDDDETCFSNMSKYDEGEAGNSVALWEDIELRGFLPLQPAHLILDFLRKHSTTSSTGDKEKKARAERILAAGRTLVSVIRVGQQGVYYDRVLKKFCIGDEPKSYSEDHLAAESVDIPESNGMTQQGVLPIDDGKSFSPKKELNLDGEEEDEVIVFKPTVLEKPINFDAPRSSAVYEAITEGSLRNSYNNVDWTDYGSTSISAPSLSPQLRAAADVLDSSIQRSAAFSGVVPQNLSHINPTGLKWNQQLTDGIKNLNSTGNGHVASDLVPSQTHMSPVLSLPFSIPISVNNTSMPLGSQMGVPEGLASLRLGSVMSSGASAANSFLMGKPANSVASTYVKRNMVSRPVSRHVGPPPGFSPIPSRQITDPKSNLTLLNEQLSVADDYRWLDGYQNQASDGMGPNKFLNPMGHMHSHVASINNMSDNVMNFPFPGKQVSDLQSASVENHRIWQDNPFENQKLYKEPQQQQQQQLQLGIDQSAAAAAANQYQGHSLWSSQFFV